MLAARLLAARALGMNGLTFFGGAVQNPERATPTRRAVVVLAALVASYLVAGVCFALGAVTAGKTTYASAEVQPVPDRAAAVAGMLSGDRVLSVAGRPVRDWDELASAIAAHTGEPTEIVARRGDEEVRFTVTPVGEPGHGKIGVMPGPGSARHEHATAGDVLDALVVMPTRCVVATARGLAAVVTGSTAGELMGPVGIVREANRATDSGAGATFLITLLAMMLANVWPLTALVALATVPRRARG